MEAIDKDSCWFTSYMCVDPKLKFIPDTLINFVIKRAVNEIPGRLQNRDMFQSFYEKGRAAGQ